jgi:hypothetical protein
VKGKGGEERGKGEAHPRNEIRQNFGLSDFFSLCDALVDAAAPFASGGASEDLDSALRVVDRKELVVRLCTRERSEGKKRLEVGEGRTAVERRENRPVDHPSRAILPGSALSALRG